MTYFDRAGLTAAAEVDPWDLLAKLRAGDPAQIEALAAAFYRAGADMSDARAAAKASQHYVGTGYRVHGEAPVDYTAEAMLTAKSIAGGADRLPAVAKVLDRVAEHLASATRSAAGEVAQLDAAVSKYQREWEEFWRGVGHHLSYDEFEPVRRQLVTDAVAAVTSHGGVVQRTLTEYEATLASSLRSMADLGYIPPDAIDEGPGDVDPDRADGVTDATNTIGAINSGNHTEGVLRYDASTEYLDLLNRKMKAGGRLTDAEYSYLWNYANTIGPHLPALDRWLNDPATGRAAAGIDGTPHNIPDAAQQAAQARGSIVADGVLNLTRAAELPTDGGAGPYPHGRGGVDGLPPGITDYLTMDLGAQVPNDPALDPDPRHPGTTLRATWDPQTGQWVVAGQSQAYGFTNLLAHYASPDVAGGRGFSTAIGAAGVRWKQELNTIQHNTQAYYQAELEHYGNSDPQRWAAMVRDIYDEGGHQRAADYMRAMGWPADLPPIPFSRDVPFLIAGDDSGASDALSLAARNPLGAADLLLDADDRRAVIGLNWNDAHGAAEALVAGTAPSTDDHSPTNQAALAVMKDAAADYRDLSATAASEVKDALTTIAIDHISSFAPTDMTEGMRDITLPDGTVLHVVGVDQATGENYLKLISSFGDAHYSLVQRAGLEAGAQYVAHAHVAGQNSLGYANAWRMAADLDGHIAGAGQAQLYDQFHATNESNVQKLIAAHQIYRNQLASSSGLTGTLKWLTSAVGLGSTVAGVTTPLAGAKLPLDLLRQGLTMLTNTVGAPHNPLDDPAVFRKIYDQLDKSVSLEQENARIESDRDRAEEWMATRALEILSPHRGYNQPTALPLPNGSDQSSPSIADTNAIENRMYSREPGVDGPTVMGTTAYNRWAGDETSIPHWTVGSGPADPNDIAAPGGSWGDAGTQAQIRYGGNDRIDWKYGLASSESPGTGNPVLPHPVLDTDTSTGDDTPRKSTYDYPAR